MKTPENDSRVFRQGIALLLTVGVLVLLSLSAVAMLNIVSSFRMHASVHTDRVMARLLAHSGVEYAAARLFQDPVAKIPPTIGNQPEDWSCRDDRAVPLEQVRNPSYAHMEPYEEAGAANGKYDVGMDAFTDLNGNGTFDSWSGRLRGRRGMAGSTFSLRVEGGSRINVNDGYLDSQDRNHNSTPDFKDLGLRCGYISAVLAPGFSDGDGSDRDTCHPTGVVPRNRRLADLIDELGLILNVDSASKIVQLGDWDMSGVRKNDPVRLAQAAAIKAIIMAGQTTNALQWSEVGDRIVSSRPAGGYRSFKELKGVLGEDWDRLAPFLSLSSPGKLPFWGSRGSYNDTRMFSDDGSTYTAADLPFFVAERSPVGLSTSPVPVLQALVQGVRVGHYGGDVDAAARIVQVPEAKLLAQAIAAHEPFSSWYEFVQWLTANSGRFFTGSWDDITRKVNAVELQLNPNELDNFMVDYVVDIGWYPLLPPYSWYSYDLDRGAPFAPGDPRYPRLSKQYEQRQVRNPPPSQMNARGPAVGYWGTYPAVPHAAAGGDFQVESLGKAGAGTRVSCSATLRDSTFACTGSQAGFEDLEGGRKVGDGLYLSGKPAKDRLQTWPFFSLDSCPDYVQSDDPDVRNSAFYLPTNGTIRLMDYTPGPLGGKEVFYLPCWEAGQPLRKPPDASPTLESFRDAYGATPIRYPTPSFCVGPVFPGSCDRLVFFWRAGSDSPSYGKTRSGVDFNPSDFPLLEHGVVAEATIETYLLNVWSIVALKWGGAPGSGTSYDGDIVGYFNDMALDYPMSVSVKWSVDSNVLQSIRTVPAPEPHRVTLAVGPGGVHGYVDGIADPGLVSSDYAPAPAAFGAQARLTCLDEVRLFREDQGQSVIGSRATMLSRHWVSLSDGEIPADIPPETRQRLKTIPSFTSPLYRFDRPAWVTGVGWEGFVPNAIRQAAGPSDIPLRVELSCYEARDGSGTEWRIPFDPSFGKQGGGWADFRDAWQKAYPEIPMPRIGSWRFQVWMDASFVSGVNFETPVFNAIEMSYREGIRMLSLEE